MPDCLLYGAYGYTGQLITAEAAQRGITLLLGGRNPEKLQPLADRYNMPYRAFSLDDTHTLRDVLREVRLVLHAAGPFKFTAQPMIQACLQVGRHYLDITGELETFEYAASQHEQARAAGVVLMPGVGYDVVPTDCMAAHLKAQLPDAQRLQLGIASRGGGFSRGTASTMIENMGYGGAVRQNGKIRKVPAAYRTRGIPFTSERKMSAMTIPWGDVSTAYYTTGIPNVEVYMAVPPKTIRYAHWQRYLGWLLRSNWFKKRMLDRVRAGKAGPDADQRSKASSYVWGRVENERGEHREARMRLMDGYTLTAKASVELSQRTLHATPEPGFHTPASVYGADFILDFPGTVRENL